MDDEVKKAGVYSLAAHALLIFIAFGGFKSCGGGLGKGGEGNGQKEHEGSIIEKKADEIEVVIPTPDKGKVVKKPKQKFVDRECGDLQWFGGIGVEVSPARRVTRAPKGYPAEQMGVEVGDDILNFSEITGEPGSEVIVKISRKGEQMSFKGLREKICVEPTPDESQGVQ